MASHSQLKYGARLINSFLGNNSTISCCEVLNSLIYPFHEQHHNNSFLIAATVMGQSNIAAGATLGSNHNSRAADGELQTGRGFWPGLCVSLKHNSKFASFTLLAKGDYPAEMHIPMPFCLVNNDVSNNKLVIMPAYWFMYNLYALARNAAKYADRDKRTKKLQYIEYSFLAPDSVNEIFTALNLIRKFTAYAVNPELKKGEDEAAIQEGERLLHSNAVDFRNLEILADGLECTNRPTQLIKVKEAYELYKKLVVFYGVEQLSNLITQQQISSFEELLQTLPAETKRIEWTNVGGQLLPKDVLQNLLTDIREGLINSWSEVHNVYQEAGRTYEEAKQQHAFASLLELLEIKKYDFSQKLFSSLLQQSLDFKQWMVERIYESRAKDYSNEFRKMVYDNEAEMAEVVGSLKDNVFIAQQRAELERFTATIQQISQQFSSVSV
jgi:hypothetical protein